MPLQETVLAPQIAVAIPAAISAMFPKAIPMPFQVIFAQAVSTGIIKTLKELGKVSGGAGPPATGPGIGISGLQEPAMSAISMGYFSAQVGGAGVAMLPFLKGVFTPTILHMQMATLTSVSGFGGSASKVTGWSADVMGQNIVDAFPEPYKTQIINSRAGKILCYAIATGFTKHIQAVGIPGAIPSGGSDVGPIVGKIS